MGSVLELNKNAQRMFYLSHFFAHSLGHIWVKLLEQSLIGSPGTLDRPRHVVPLENLQFFRILG